MLTPLAVILYSFTLGPRLWGRKLLPIGHSHPEVHSASRRAASKLGFEKEAELYRSNKKELDAYAFGSNENPKIALTSLLLDEIHDKPEKLDAVLLHEYSHILNGDVNMWTRLHSFLSSYMYFGIIFGLYNLWVVYFLFNTWIGSSERTEVLEEVTGIFFARLLVLLAFFLVPYLIAKSILRIREHLADATYLRASGNPETLISTIRLISGEEGYADIASLPFSEHPPLKSREEAIRSRRHFAREPPGFWGAFWTGSTLTFTVLMAIDLLLAFVSLSLGGNEQALEQAFALWGPDFYFLVEITVPVVLISLLFSIYIPLDHLKKGLLRGAFCCFTYVAGLLVYYLTYHTLHSLPWGRRIPTISRLSVQLPEYILWIFDWVRRFSRSLEILSYRFLRKPLEPLGPGLTLPISGWVMISVILFCLFIMFCSFAIFSKCLFIKWRKWLPITQLSSRMRYLFGLRRVRLLAFVLPQILIVFFVFYTQVPQASRHVTLGAGLQSGLDSEGCLPPTAEKYIIVAYFFEDLLETNFYVIHSLAILDALDHLESDMKDQVIDWLTLHVSPDGSIKSRYYWWSEEFSYPDVDYTYFTLHSLHSLNAMADVDRNSIASFLKNSTLVYVDDAYYNVGALNVLNMLVEANKSTIGSFVGSCQYLEKQNYSEPYATRELMVNYGGFSIEPQGWVTMTATYYALSTLRMLDLINCSNSDAVVEWILKHQAEDGGFCSELSLVWDYEKHVPIDTEPTEADLLSTFYTVKSLESLGQLDVIDKNETIEYVLNLQRRTGIFGHGLSDGYAYEDSQESIHKSTYMALSILQSLNATNLLDSGFPSQKIVLEILRDMPLIFFLSVAAVVCLDVFLRWKRVL